MRTKKKQPVKKKNKRAHSYSRHNRFFECPFAYKKEYIDKTPYERTFILEKGAIIHDALAIYTKECLRQRKTHVYDQYEDITRQALRNANIAEEHESDIFEAVKTFAQQREIP